MRQRTIVWFLMPAIIFFSVQGMFSFFQAGGADARGVVGKLVFPAIAYGIVVYAILTRARAVTRLMMRMPLLTLLAGFTIFSALWSQEPARSAATGVLYLLDTLFAFYLADRFDPDEQMSLVMIGGATVCLLGLLLILLLPQYGLDQSARTPNAFRGLFIFRTGSALMMTFALSPALVLGRKGFTYRRFLFIVLLAIFILRAQVATAILVLLGFFALLILLRLTYRLERGSLAVLALITLPVAAVLLGLGYAHLDLVFKALGRDPTLTGRTEIWAALFRSIAKRPLLGYGYRAFWNGLSGESAEAIIAAHWLFGYAHNGYLEVVLQLGYVGLGLFFLTFLQAVRNAYLCYRADRSLATEWYMGLLFLTVFYNISEETIVWPSTFPSILYIMACVGLAEAARKVKAEQRERVESSESMHGAGKLRDQPAVVAAG